MVTTVSKASSKAKEEETPKTSETQPRAERYEKQEKGEKHEKNERQEKHEKGTPEKYEKHEKRGVGILGSVIAGILLVVFGVLILLINTYNISADLGWPIFLVIVGIAVILYVIFAASTMRRNPSPPPA
jgi:cation transport ATPase